MVGNLNLYISIALLVSIMFGGYEHFAYKQYRSDIEATAKAQQIAVEATKKQQELATKGIEDAYKSKIYAIRATYGMHNPSSGAMPTIPNTTIRIDDPASNWVLAQQCTETTQQLVSLQDWIRLQVGLNGNKWTT